MSDVMSIINNSISKVLEEVSDSETINSAAEGVKDLAKKGVKAAKNAYADAKDTKLGKALAGGIGEKIYDKLNPEKPDLAHETVKKLSAKLAEERNAGVGEHLTKAGKKAIENIKEHPAIAAATAAGLAAAVGGLAAVKKMRKAAKK